MNTPLIICTLALAPTLSLVAPEPVSMSPDGGAPAERQAWSLPADGPAAPQVGVAGTGGTGPRECPPGVTYGQRPHQPDASFVFDTSDVAPNRALYERFQHNGSDLTNIWFWGADFNLLTFSECNEPNPLFSVSFHPDTATGEPDLSITLCSYVDVPAREKVFKDAYPIPGTSIVVDAFQYKVNFDPPCALPAGSYWVKVQGIGGQADCWFLWLSSPEGDGTYFTVEPPPDPAHFTPGDLSLCINRPEEQAPYCPADLDGNKVVDVDDLVTVILSWGPCPAPCPPACPGDVNGDCVVDVDDLVAIILAWGHCPTPLNDECVGKIDIVRVEPDGLLTVPFDVRGATPSPEPLQCIDVDPNPFKDAWWCLRNGTDVPKIVVVRTDLAAFLEVTAGCQCPPGPLVACGPSQGGVTFPLLPGQGVCLRLVNDQELPNEQLKGRLEIENLPMLTGACCLPDGTCVQITLLECKELGGLYLGDFTGCAGIECPPPLGACCLPDGTCTVTSAFNCHFLFGGLYLGDGTGCNAVECPPVIGACCLPDGACILVTALECEELGGLYLGDGSACVGVECPPANGACCLPDGTCVQVPAFECELVGGLYLGDGTGCTGVTCPPLTGACCLPDGTCIQVPAFECELIGGLYLGDGTLCTAVECPMPLGACCRPDGTCTVTTAAGCESIGGVYQGDGSGCAGIVCPPRRGACCLPDGSCVEATQAECEGPLLGGAYQGDGTTCTAVECPPTVGACCLPDGTCILATLLECRAIGGLYLGDGTLCTTSDVCPSPLGACCLPDGTCILTTLADCDAAGGVYLGNGTGCAGIQCPPPSGVCCLPDGTCLQITDKRCQKKGGVFLGVGTTCTSVECPPTVGACCLPDGTCVVTTQAECEDPAVGGVYQGDGVPCVPNPCPPPTGVCCLPDGTCLDGITAKRCELKGGVFQGVGTTCNSVECPPTVGACCLPDGTCIVTTQVECEAAGVGGVYQGDGVPCVPNPCPPPTGVCCLPDGTCLDGITAKRCEIKGGVFQGVGTTCNSVECPPTVGACCLPDGTCIVTTQVECEAAGVGGVYQGDGVPCVPNPCPPLTGACCFPDGTCIVTTAAECEDPAVGGVYQGDGVPCVPNPCPPLTGACCLPDGTCVVTILIECDAIGGVYQGDGVPCVPDPCGGGGVNFHTDIASFFEAVVAAGKTEKFFWNFKPDLLQPGAVVPVADGLNIDTHPMNAPGVWSDATGTNLWPQQVDNVTFYSNQNPTGPLRPDDVGLAYAKAPAFGLNNNALFAEEHPLSFDIVSGPPAGTNHTAFALELVALGGGGTPNAVLVVTVFDKDEEVLGTFVLTVKIGHKAFLGVITKDPAVTIGRIDIWDEFDGFEGISALAAFAQLGPPPLGACCIPGAACTETTPTDCLAMGGAYQGNGVTCDEVQCQE